MNELQEMGYNELEAWEIVRESYLFPPEEGSKSSHNDSPLYRQSGSPTEMMHAAFRSGARTVEVPRTTLTATDLKNALKGR